MSDQTAIIAELKERIIELETENSELRHANEAFEKLFTEIEAGFDEILEDTAD